MNISISRNKRRLAACALLLSGSAIAADPGSRHLYLDVHNINSVTAEAVADAHRKDLAVQDQYGVKFVRYWVDEQNSKVYCLSEAPSAEAVLATHRKAHGLVSDEIAVVTEGQ